MSKPTFAEWQHSRGIRPWPVVHGQSWFGFLIDLAVLWFRRTMDTIAKALTAAVRSVSEAMRNITVTFDMTPIIQ